VPLDLFHSVISLLREAGTIVPLSELLELQATGRRTTGLFSVTFDDAYASLLSVAGGLLINDQIPATVFVATDFTAHGARFWWDRVEDLYPRVSAQRWRAFEAELGIPAEYRTGQPEECGPLRPLRQWVLREFTGRWPSDLEPVLGNLESEVGFVTKHRAMTFEEIRSLAERTPIEIGAHTMTHPVLPLLSGSEMRDEIGQCREILEGRFGNIVRALAAPFGLYDARTVNASRWCGLRHCLSVSNQVITNPPAPGVLSRFIISAGEKPWKLRLKLTGVVEQFRPPAYLDTHGFPRLPSPTT
jgi:peptidoglycan/xylan/chitin deacetylase (PgdA/CDA1 family)